MANNVTNYLKVIANDETTNRIDEMFDNAGGYAQTLKLSETFFGESAKDSNEWFLDNLGAKWLYVENNIDMGEWNLQSANYPPKEFFIHLYKLISETDPDGYLEVRYEDESLSPVGALVVKKGPNGEICFKDKEDYDMDDPTIKMADINILDNLTTPEEMSGIINKAILHLNRLLERGNFTGESSILKKMSTIINLANPLGAWYEERVYAHLGSTINRDEAYNDYVKWSRDNGLGRPKPKRRMTSFFNARTDIVDRDFTRDQWNNRIPVWSGFMLGEEDTETVV